MKENKIGFWSSTALVLGNMIGSGIFLLPASLAIYGSISILGWIFSALGAVLLSIVFGNLNRFAPNLTGGPYAFTKLKLGAFPAFLVAWSYWISIWCTNAAIAVALVGYLGVFFPILSANGLSAIIAGLFFIWLLSWINTKPIKTIGIVQLLTTILKVIPIVFLTIFGILYLMSVEQTHFPAFNLSQDSNWSTLTSTVTMTFFAFLGIESATIPSSKIENSQEVVRKATMTGTGIAILTYVGSYIVVISLIPSEILSESSAPFADAAAVLWGETGRKIVALGAVVSTLGALNGWILIQGQIPMAASNDQLFPKIFGKVNSNNSPIYGILISSVLASLLMMCNYSKSLVETFTFMMLLSTLSVLMPYLFSTASYALFLFQKKEKDKNSKLFVAFLSFLFTMWIIVGCGADVVFWGFLLVMSGIPFYVWLKKD